MAVFPAMPHGRAGIRFAITLHQQLEQIELMIETLAVAYRSVFDEELVIELTEPIVEVDLAEPAIGA